MDCRHVDAVRKRFRDSIYPGITLPPSYNKALGALELLHINQVIYRANRLEELLPYILGLQNHLKLGPDVSLSNTIGFLKRKISVNT
jgi:hypothetical protein